MSVSQTINDTSMNHSDDAKHPIMQAIIKISPLGRRGTPDEIANVISFITSDVASLLTGSDVLADGGMVTVLPAACGTESCGLRLRNEAVLTRGPDRAGDRRRRGIGATIARIFSEAGIDVAVTARADDRSVQPA